ncbi:peptidoglycan recognition protein family protein [Streptomyces sp. bgisy027]|uniref:peptidoglycan recognition protein family protein n=1 Tax=Streptomyces sp. bgisy027 TaxID=3413770 RepID=UPI003D75B7B9
MKNTSCTSRPTIGPPRCAPRTPGRSACSGSPGTIPLHRSPERWRSAPGDAATGTWSEWRLLDSDSSRAEETARRGGTDPLWVGPSDGAEVRITADADTVSGLPDGLRLDLIDPGPGDVTPSAPAGLANTAVSDAPAVASAPRPAITSRARWGADESISPAAPGYLPGGKIKAAVVHHTAGSNSYTCTDAPAVVRGIHAYHVGQLGWKDIGYNFLIDKCGTIYEGRKGGVDRPVLGSHAYGFNSQTTGIAVLGTYTSTTPSKAVLTSVANLAAWKLGQHGVNPAGTAKLTAGADGTNYFRKSWKLGANCRCRPSTATATASTPSALETSSTRSCPPFAISPRPPPGEPRLAHPAVRTGARKRPPCGESSVWHPTCRPALSRMEPRRSPAGSPAGSDAPPHRAQGNRR